MQAEQSRFAAAQRRFQALCSSAWLEGGQLGGFTKGSFLDGFHLPELGPCFVSRCPGDRPGAEGAVGHLEERGADRPRPGARGGQPG